MEVSPSRSLGSFEPFAWRMKVRRMPSAPPNSPASNTTLSRGDAWPDWDASVVVQSSWANTNAAKSTSRESSTSRSRVDRPGLNVVVQGSTSATSPSPRAIAWRSLACLPDDPRKIRGMFMPDSPFGPAPRFSVLIEPAVRDRSATSTPDDARAIKVGVVDDDVRSRHGVGLGDVDLLRHAVALAVEHFSGVGAFPR